MERFSDGLSRRGRPDEFRDEEDFVVDDEGGFSDVVPVFEALLEGPLPGRRLPRVVGSREKVERAVAVLVSYGLIWSPMGGGQRKQRFRG